jgi:hypothetical protein
MRLKEQLEKLLELHERATDLCGMEVKRDRLLREIDTLLAVDPSNRYLIDIRRMAEGK